MGNAAQLFDDAVTAAAIGGLVAVAHAFDAKGWSPATSSNYSARVAPDRVVITKSGFDKGGLGVDDFLLVDLHGNTLTPGKPSAETAAHLALYRRDPNTGCVLHMHAPNGVVLSRGMKSRGKKKRRVTLQGWELQKAFTGVVRHDVSLRVPILDNDQDMQRVAARLLDMLPNVLPEVPQALDPANDTPQHMADICYGVLLRGHGLYAWGADVASARRHAEAYEYLFGCELALAQMRPG